MLRLELPYPPSLNHYHRYVRGRVVISRRGKEFRVRVWWLLRSRRLSPLSGPLAVVIDAYPPDRRVRDLDNLEKATLDSIQNGGAFHDDSQVAWLLIRRQRVQRGGKVVVSIVPFDRLRDVLIPWLIGDGDVETQDHAA